MFHIFHFFSTSDIAFGNVNPFSWKVNAISGEKSCLISMPFLLERFSIECRKTKVITPTNHKEDRQYSEPIKTSSNY